uniref:Uncharacterized protein n=1 Tax=Anopheles minimus TaxID=112268 RepID=A0A182WMV5_9DIPT
MWRCRSAIKRKANLFAGFYVSICFKTRFGRLVMGGSESSVSDPERSWKVS